MNLASCLATLKKLSFGEKKRENEIKGEPNKFFIWGFLINSDMLIVSLSVGKSDSSTLRTFRSLSRQNRMSNDRVLNSRILFFPKWMTGGAWLCRILADIASLRYSCAVIFP